MSINHSTQEPCFEISLCLDEVQYKKKPKSEVANINNRIANSKVVLKTPAMLQNFAKAVGEKGQSFTPATFRNGRRRHANFEQLQLLVLDFDSGISVDEVKARAEQYWLPILFIYETLSSKENDKFRVVFINDVPITEPREAKVTLSALSQIFHEADPSCTDVSRMFFGGKDLLYFDDSLPKVNIGRVFEGFTHYLEDSKGKTHYKEHIRRFALEHRIRLNRKGLLDVSIIEGPPEIKGAYPMTANRENLTNPHSNIIPCGEILPNLPSGSREQYRIQFTGECTQFSGEGKRLRIHAPHRSSILDKIAQRCWLYAGFASGMGALDHAHLFGIATNIIHIEGGIARFKYILSCHPGYYDCTKVREWDRHLKYIKDMDYIGKYCIKFCEYAARCSHESNILSTVTPKLGTMEKLPGYKEEFNDIKQVQKDVKKEIKKAVESPDKKWHIIKAQTAIGKTKTYLELMKTSGQRYLIAAPTNRLKNDIYERALKKKIKVMMTPSLHEINKDIPPEVWAYINFLYKNGKSEKVNPYIAKMAKEKNIECLKEYLLQKKGADEFRGHIITTHRKFMNMSEEMLKKFDVIIIDEDIILNSIATDECIIPLSVLEEAYQNAIGDENYAPLSDKLSLIHEAVKSKKFIELPSFDFNKECAGIGEEGDIDDRIQYSDILGHADIPAFSLAKRFILLKKNKWTGLSEDSIVFLRPHKFHNVKHIMVSATVDKEVCEHYFGKDKVTFTECKYAPYRGRLDQYHAKTMSRSSIDHDPTILDRIAAWPEDKPMITFKKYKRYSHHFGNAIGCDDLKGKNINVVGTPYTVNFKYELLAFTLGLKVDENAKMGIYTIQRNGYQFNFTTYGDEYLGLRNIHLWMIESELEQAVGRARLLREDCFVYLYSNFPLRQANMKGSYPPGILNDRSETLMDYEEASVV